MSDKDEDGYNCRVCFENFTNRTDVIVPCKCSGSGKYICKDCLNKYITNDKNDIKYTTCPSCKSKYIREQPKIPIDLNNETRDEVLYGVGVITLVTLGFLLGGKFSSVSIFFVLCLYFYSMAVFITASGGFGNTYIYWLILAVYFFVLFAPKKISYFVYGLWTISVFAFICKRILDVKWELLNNSKTLKLTEKLGCKMFDFGIGRYVPGIV